MTDDSDPFAPFRRMFEQFDAGSTSSAPPGLGLPFSPLSMMGGEETPSPEDATKRAVRQLYQTMEALSGSGASGDYWERYFDATGMDPGAFGPEQVSAAATRTYRIWFYSLMQILVETYTLRLVQDELVVEGHRTSTRTQEWLWGLPQSDREQLLLRCTDVEDELVEEMQTLRKRRDRLLYSFGDWTSVEFDESVADARRALDVLTALDDRVTEGSTFSYVPEASGDGETAERCGEADEGETGDAGPEEG